MFDINRCSKIHWSSGEKYMKNNKNKKFCLTEVKF